MLALRPRGYACTRCMLVITPGGNVVENGERTGHVSELVRPLVEVADGEQSRARLDLEREADRACAICGGSTVPLDSPDPVFDRRCSSCDWFGRRPKERMNLPAKLAAYADKRIAAAESRVLGVLRNLRAREEHRDRAQLAQLAPLVAPEPAREPTAEELADRQRFAQKRAEDRAAQRAKREADDFDEVLDRAMKSWEHSAGARQDLPRGRN